LLILAFVPAADANPALSGVEGFEKGLMIRESLQQCCRTGTLSRQEYELLSKAEVEGVEIREVARLDAGPSTAAVRRRLQRIVSRLYKAALQMSREHQRNTV
jgi:hypothetical protein